MQGHYQLRITIKDWDDTAIYAAYDYFKIGSPEEMYTLQALVHSGTASRICMFVNVKLYFVKSVRYSFFAIMII